MFGDRHKFSHICTPSCHFRMYKYLMMGGKMIENLIIISTSIKRYPFVFGFGSAMGSFTKLHVWATKIEFDDRL